MCRDIPAACVSFRICVVLRWTTPYQLPVGGHRKQRAGGNYLTMSHLKIIVEYRIYIRKFAMVGFVDCQIFADSKLDIVHK